MLKLRHLILILCLGFLLGACEPTERVSPIAKKGQMDLQGWDFEKSGPVSLNGEWSFYWQELKEPGNLDIESNYVAVPDYWSNYEGAYPSHGYATYHLKVLLDQDPPTLGFKILSLGTAYQLYVNGQLIAENGVVSKEAKSATPNAYPLIGELDFKSNTLDIVIHVSNYHHRHGGIWRSIQLGDRDTLLRNQERVIALSLLLVGCLLIMAFYHLGIYFFRNQDYSALYFGLVSFLFALHTLVTGERYLLHIFPEIPWSITFRLEYLSVYLGFPLYIMFFQSVYPQEFSRRVMRGVTLIGLLLSGMVLFSPSTWFTYTIEIIQLLMIAVGIYATYTLVLAVYRKRDTSIIFLLGFLIFAATLINDSLYNAQIVQSGKWVSFGFLIFTFTQAIVLSIRYSRSFSAVEELSDNLEKRVQMRTQQLELKSRELESQKNEIEKKNSIIQKKNQNITASITYASRIQKAIIGNEDAITSNFKDSFIFLKPKDIVSGDFYWYTEVKRSVTLKDEEGNEERQTVFFKIIAAADCTGHGIPGAFMTVMGNALLDEIINENKVTNPSRVLSVLDRKLLMKLRQHNVNDGMDMALLVFDDENQRVSFAGANNPLYFIRDGEVHQIRGSKFPIGSTQYKKKKKFELHNIDYQPGDVFYIFSDGYQDQFGGEKGQKYYKKRFREYLVSISHLPMKEQKELLSKELEDWQGEEPQTDDILVIGITP